MSSQLPVPSLCRTITALIAKGDQATEKAEQFYIAAGKHLAELKERRPEDIAWAAYVEKQCKISRRRADELIQIADGRTTLEKSRAAKAESVERTRYRPDPALRSAGIDSQSVTYPSTGISVQLADPPTEDEYDDPQDDEETRKASFVMRAGEALQYAFYEGPIDPIVLRAARQTADAWEKLATNLARRMQ